MSITKFLAEARRPLSLVENDHYFPAVLQTPLGKLNIRIGAKMITYSADKADPLTVFGKKVGDVVGGFQIKDDGSLRMDPGDYGYTGMFSSASQAAQKKILGVAQAAIEKYIHQNPGHFNSGKKLGLQKDMEGLKRDITAAENHLAELRRRESALQREIDAL